MSLPIEVYYEGSLQLPEIFIEAYTNKLIEIGKLEESKINLQGVVGGDQDEEAITHFVGRFPNGAVRSEYIVLDPDKDLSNISTQLATVFSDKELQVLYLPCGAGAGLLGLLTTFITLRKHEYYPTLPLNINVIGADYSLKALELFIQMLEPIAHECKKVGINLTYSSIQWDATNGVETMSLLHNFFAQSADEYFIFFSNISGAAGSNSTFDNSFSTILNYVSTLSKNSTILWIEPGNFNKAEKLFKKLMVFIEPIKKLWLTLLNSGNDVTDIPNKTFTWIHPTSTHELRGNISGLRLIIDGNDDD